MFKMNSLRVSRLITLVLITAIVVVSLMRLALAVTRYFDADEFAHLHWSYLLTQGFMPYRDFFMNFTPLFNWFLALLFALPASPTILIAARLIQWLIFGGIALCVGLLGLRTKLSPQSIFLAVLTFLVFPITLDKTIEVRADSLMTLLFLSSVLVAYAIGRFGRRGAWASGFLAAFSVLLLTKAIILIPALLVVLILEIRGAKNWKTLLVWWIIGTLTPVIAFLTLMAWQGILPAAMTQIIAGSIAIKQGEGAFSPFLPLGSYPIIYDGVGGALTYPWVVSTICWVLAGLGLMKLLWDGRPFGVFAALFLGGSIVGLFLFPTPYVQYFIPATAVASVLVGYVINDSVEKAARMTFLRSTEGSPLSALQRLRFFGGEPSLSEEESNRNDTISGRRASPKKASYALLLVISLLLSSFFLQYRQRTAPGSDNTEQLQVIRDVLTATRPDETIYDMVGSYVFRPDGHPICCNEYARFGRFLPFPVPSLAEMLVTRRTKFIVLDRLGKSLWLPTPEDLTFVVSNYLPTSYNKIYSLGLGFRCQNGACAQYTLNNQPAVNHSTNTFTILVPETYTVSLKPDGEVVTIDGNQVHDGQTLSLSKGVHRFWTPPLLAGFRVQLAR